MSESKKLAKNTILIAISKLSTQLLAFVMLPFYTLWLSTGEYGLADLVITYGSLFMPLVLLNMDMAVFRFLIDVRKDREGQNEVITNALELVLWAILGASILFVPIPLLFDISIGYVAFAYFLAIAFNSVIMGIARGLGRTAAFAVVGIAQGVLSVALIVVFVYVFGWGAEGMIAGMTIGALLAGLSLAVYLRVHRYVHLSARSIIQKKSLIGYSLPLLPNSVSWWVTNASDRTILALAVSVAANGIYAVSTKFSGVLASLWGVFYMSWSETAAVNINKPNRDALFSYVANVAVRVFGSLALIGIAATSIIFPFLVHKTFEEGLLYVPVLMIAAFLNSVVGFYSAVYVAKKLTRQVMRTSIVAAAVNISINLALVWTLGIWAVAIGFAVTYAMIAINRHYDMKKHVAIRYDRGIFVKLVAAFVTLGALYYVPHVDSTFSWLKYVAVVFALLVAWLLNKNTAMKMWQNFSPTRRGIFSIK